MVVRASIAGGAHRAVAAELMDDGAVAVPDGRLVGLVRKTLLDAVATVGPVSVAVDASIGWQLYFGGIV